MYQNYIFDLYGTLVDIHTNENKAYLYEKMADVYSALGAIYTKTEWKRAYREGCRKRKAAHENPYYEIELKEVFAELFTSKQTEADEKVVQTVSSIFRVLSRSYMRLYDGVEEFLELCRKKGKKVYLLSNAQSVFTIPELKALGLYDRFDGILISSDAGVCKPDIAIMDELLKRYHLKKEESIMIGNDRTSDILIAKNSHMDSLYIHSNISPAAYTEEEKMVGATYEIMDGDFRKIKQFILK